jgi:Zn-dependent M28 family amino/carboxypeptidase
MTRHALSLAATIGAAGGLLAQQPPATDPRIAAIARAPSAARLEQDVRRLVSFGTRHTLSDTLSATRGIGAARRWIKAEFDRIAAACGGCLEVFYVAQLYDSLPRIPRPTSVVSVVAVQRGTTDPDRFVVISGHLDSRNSDAMNAVDSAPGANDDGSGTVAVIEAARVLSGHTFNGSIAYAALAGEEQGLLGGRAVARYAREHGWRIVAVLNNDIVGNISGQDGVTDSTMVRVFSDGTPPTETDAERRRRRFTGGEVDGSSRQVARYVDRIADRYLPGFDVWMIYRLDRFGRGGDHREFADLGYPAVRITEGHEHYDRQHQNVRVENGRAYGDLVEGVHFGYLARVTGLNAASLAALAWAPGPPDSVRIAGGVQPAARLRWNAPADSANVAGYRVYWRRTDSPTWDQSAWVGDVRTHTFTGLVIDNWFFGVASVGRDGNESPVVFPTPGGN